MVKSIIVAYVLWAVGGPLGLHHVYLGRDSHALLWILTLGGFGFGWVREVIRIPAYVSEANQAAGKKKKSNPTTVPPPVCPVRFAGQVCVGMYFGTVAFIGLRSLKYFYLIVLPLSVGAGVHLVSSAGQQTSNLQKTLTTCLLISPLFYGSTLSPLPISLAASVTAAQYRSFKPQQTAETTQKLGPRLYRLSLALLAFSAPLGYCIFHNTTATLYYLSDCVAALLDAFWFLPWLRSVLEYILLMPYWFFCFLTGGGYYDDTWQKVLKILLKEYTEREIEALQVLSLNTEASFEDITHSYRELVKKWHPDHNQDKDANGMFMKIQDSYEALLRRHRPNRFK